MIAVGKTDNPFVEIPFPGAPLGLYNGKPWFLPFAGAYYKSSRLGIVREVGSRSQVSGLRNKAEPFFGFPDT